MPEFILDHGTPRAAEKFRKLDEFAQGYVEALFFTESGSDCELDGKTVADLSRDAWTAIKRDCDAFQKAAADLLSRAYEKDDYSAEQAGRDFWYTRNGHGAGFWDRKELERDGIGDALSELCGHGTDFQEVNPYVTETGWIRLF